MIYGEVGKLPMQVSVDRHLISYWLRILDKDENTLVHIIYMIALNLFLRDEYKTIWLNAFLIIVVYHICGAINK